MPKKVDDNQKEIVECLRDLGFSVWHTHEVGKGFPDLCLGLDGYTILAEVKIPGKALNDKQEKFFTDWKGWTEVLYDLDDCVRLKAEVKDLERLNLE